MDRTCSSSRKNRVPSAHSARVDSRVANKNLLIQAAPLRRVPLGQGGIPELPRDLQRSILHGHSAVRAVHLRWDQPRPDALLTEHVVARQADGILRLSQADRTRLQAVSVIQKRQWTQWLCVVLPKAFTKCLSATRPRGDSVRPVG